jgi:hypothetical protein
MSGHSYANPGYTIELLDRLKELGLTDESFRLVHHLARKGTKKETIAGMRSYCETVGHLNLQNERVTKRLEFILNSYRFFDLRPGATAVFDALAEAAWLGIPSD